MIVFGLTVVSADSFCRAPLWSVGLLFGLWACMQWFAFAVHMQGPPPFVCECDGVRDETSLSLYLWWTIAVVVLRGNGATAEDEICLITALGSSFTAVRNQDASRRAHVNLCDTFFWMPTNVNCADASLVGIIGHSLKRKQTQEKFTCLRRTVGFACWRVLVDKPNKKNADETYVCSFDYCR